MKISHTVLRTFGVFLLAGIALASTPPAVGPADAQRYLNDIKTLTQPKMEGRGEGSKGLVLAEHVLRDRYKSYGLEPAGSNGYLQSFTVTTGAKLHGKNDFVVENGPAKSEIKLNQEYVPFSFSSSGTASGPVVFAGYGITAEEFGYDDYAGIDVKDKIVVVLRYEPGGFATKSGNQGLTNHSQFITKAINARNHGAKALILVNGKLNPGEEDLLTRFGSVNGPESVGVMFVQVRHSVADAWFHSAGTSLGDAEDKINSQAKPASFAFPEALRASLAVAVENTHATVNNVLAYLPGTTDEYIILGAHYDHLGRGNFDSLAPSQIGQIHPGADDNASGTAGLLELARLLSPLKGQLQRGILFASFAGEELGLLGSAEWVKEPTKPLEKAVAMLNMDMIGRIKDGKVYVGGVGTGSTFAKVLGQAETGCSLKFEASQGGYASSDHTSFVSKRIPVLFFFSGLHSDYHKPSDTWEKINPNSAVELLNVVAKITVAIADEPEKPAFVVVADSNPHGGSGTGGGGGYGPAFGSIPDFGQTENGVKFSDVKPGSPAAKAGLRAGDVLIQFGDKPIKNLYDFTDALRRSKVGDVVPVTVLRDGKELKVSVTLEQRK
ncbi:MAG: M28 family peptidase [Candidatus Acidiferrum sp.]